MGKDMQRARKAIRETRRHSFSTFDGSDKESFTSNCQDEETPLFQKSGTFEIPEERAEEFTFSGDIKAISHVIFGHKLNILLLVLPFGFLSYWRDWSAGYIFALNFIGMIPLASLLGEMTEEVGLHTSETVAGLINATFGNAVEVVIAILALNKGEIRVVQASMIGSVLSNMLLVLGTCFLCAGYNFKELTYSATGASANMTLLLLSSMALILPTPFAPYYDFGDEHVLLVSRVSSIFLLSMYVQLIYFQMKTHAYLYEASSSRQGSLVAGEAPMPEEHASMSMGAAAGMLLLVTLMVAAFSEFLVSSIDGATQEWGISKTFVGIVLLPIIGNAVEHVTAVTVAMKGKIELAMGVAVGSATQVGVFVMPLVVLAGWAMDQPMTLNLPAFEICLFILSVVIVHAITLDGSSNWLEGSALLTAYFLLAVGFSFEKVEVGGGGHY